MTTTDKNQIEWERAQERRQVYGSSQDSYDEESECSSSEQEQDYKSKAKEDANNKHAAKQIQKKKPGRPRKNIPAGEESQDNGDSTQHVGKKMSEYAAQKIADRTGVYKFEEDPDKYRKARKRQQNRESAVRSRMKKREDLEVLEDEVRALQQLLAAKDTANAELIKQNALLKQAAEQKVLEPTPAIKVSSVPAPVTAKVDIMDPLDQSHEKLDNYVRDSSSGQFNQYGEIADTASGRTYIKRAKRVDSNDLQIELGVQESEPFFKGNVYYKDQFGNTSGQQELLSDGLFDRPESFMPAFGSNKEDFQENSLAANSMSLDSGFNDDFLSAKKQDSMEFEMIRKDRQYNDYNQNIGGRSILFPLAIVFCIMCFTSTGNFITSSMFQPVAEMVAQPRAPIGSVLKQGFLYKGVEDNLKIEPEIMDEREDLEIFFSAGKRLLGSMLMHWAAKFIFFFLAIVCFAEWMRTVYYAVPIKSHRSSQLRKKSSDGRNSRKQTEKSQTSR